MLVGFLRFSNSDTLFPTVLEFIFCNYLKLTYFPKRNDLTIVLFTTLRKVGSLPIGLDLKTVSAKCRIPDEPRNENPK